MFIRSLCIVYQSLLLPAFIVILVYSLRIITAGGEEWDRVDHAHGVGYDAWVDFSRCDDESAGRDGAGGQEPRAALFRYVVGPWATEASGFQTKAPGR